MNNSNYINKQNRNNNNSNNNFDNRPLSVIDFANRIGENFKQFPVYTIKGQLVDPRFIVNPKNHTTSFYASLRDEKVECRVSIKIFDKTTAEIDENIKEGDLVIVTANVAFMNKRGELYLKAKKIKLDGIGDLYRKIEEIKTRLKAEGLFDPSRKKKLPFIPKCVGLITGKGSMGISDVCHNTERRWPGISFKTREVTVDGTIPPPEMFRDLNNLQADPNVDVIVIARGGGDPQGMLMFSDEKLIRAISNCTKPVISAIGHEEDHPLIDYVADVRASTPTDVAKHLVPDWNFENETNLLMKNNLIKSFKHLLDFHSSLLKNLQLPTQDEIFNKNIITIMNFHNNLFKLINNKLNNEDDYEQKMFAMKNCINNHVAFNENFITNFNDKLTALNPRKVLLRGYAIIKSENKIIKSVKEISVDKKITMEMFDGMVNTVVKEVKKYE